MVAIARQSFHVPADGPRFEVIVADGADYVDRGAASADVLIVDGYDADAHAEELASKAFYESCRRSLKPGGMLVVNLWGGTSSSNLLLQRIEAAFPAGTLCLPAERPGNVIVFAFEGKPGPLRMEGPRATARSAAEPSTGWSFHVSWRACAR